MKQIFTIFLLSYSIIGFSQHKFITAYPFKSSFKQGSNVLLDSIVYSEKYLTTNGWGYSAKDAYSYNEKAQRIKAEWYEWDITHWWALTKDSFTYDNDGKVTCRYLFNIKNDTPYIKSMDSNIYDNVGRLANVVKKNWNIDKWDTSDVNTYNYSNNGSIVTIAYKNWNYLPGKIYALDSTSYTKNGIAIFHLYSAWDNIYNNWHDEYKYVVTSFDSYGYPKNYELWKWFGGQMYLEEKGSISYDGTGHLISLKSEVPNDSSHWVVNEEIENSYDQSGNLDDVLRKSFNDGTLNSIDSAHYYYHVRVSEIKSSESDFSFNLYPNPAKNTITVDAAKISPGILKIYDMEGKCIQSEKIEETKQVLNLQLEPGMYVYKFYNIREYLMTGKLIVVP